MLKPHQVYNATLVAREELGPGLFVIRVKPDDPLFDFRPGQYGVLGLLGGAPRCAFADSDEEQPPEELVRQHERVEETPRPEAAERLIRRAYSIASSSRAREYVEFYVVLVRSGALTPRLFALEEGDRLWLGAKATGMFTLDKVPEDRDVLLIATGTGLAPYMSMTRTLHRCGEGRRYVVVHGARFSWDLGYRAELEALDHGCGTFVYVPTVTRPEKDAPWRGHVGRIQTIFEDGTFEAKAGRPPDPARDHVFLCGNPEMVEVVQELLEARGFALDTRAKPGTIHVERYW